MPQLYYGFWDNAVYDNRMPSATPSLPDLPLEEFDCFNKGNPVEVFLSPRGFLVFSPEADLCRALAMHHRRIAERSCGKCTPCRVGSQIIAQELDKLCAEGDADWNAMRDLGEQMRDTSLCGLGSTGALPLLAAIEHFSDEMNAKPQRRGGGFYSVATTACIEACPGHVNVPRYIDYLKDGHNDLSCGVVLKNYPFDSCCGRVCVRYCEIACRRGKVDEPVDIRSLKRFAADMSIGTGLLRPTPVENGKTARIAVIGAGPAGLTCAYRLLCMGFPTDIYEAHPYSGGMIRYGIPSYRLPKDVLQVEIDLVRSMGGVFMPNQKLGRDFHVNDLFNRGYRALFLAPGCPKGSYLGMPGEDPNTPGYENGIEFLERVHDTLTAGETPSMEGDVAVVGGGNVAMDCCRTAARMTNGKVHLIYRRTEADAPADHQEIEEAKEEGVEFHFLTGQDRLVLEGGKITGLQCLRMERTEPDASGRRGVKPIPGSEFTIPCSTVIAAIGQSADPDFLIPDDGIQRDRKNLIIVDEYQCTSRRGVFAGGDGASGPRTSGPSVLVHAMAQGAVAAQSIASYLETGGSPFLPRERASAMIKALRLLENDEPCPPVPLPRIKVRGLDPEQRKHNFLEAEETLTQQEAWSEAQRCMRCFRNMSIVTRDPIPGVSA